MEHTYKEKLVNGKNVFLLDRENIHNQIYIGQCAALAFHKSLVGISELKALESVMSISSTGGLRLSRAINTYYSIYHLFVAMMLLDNKFEIRIDEKKCKEGIVNLSVNEDELNNPSEHPSIWNKAGELEQDIATKIGHGNIKWYCRNMRKNYRELKPAYTTLYNNFIKVESNHNKSIKGLFEKVCYIRDRAVYRPSSVHDTDNTSVHTSKYIRKEIESLPSSQELFDVSKKIFEQLFKQQLEGKDTLLGIFIRYFWGSHVLETEAYVKELGYTDDDIEKLKGIADKLSFSTYTSHLMELVDRERFVEDFESIWKKLSGFADYNIMNGYFMMNEDQ